MPKDEPDWEQYRLIVLAKIEEFDLWKAKIEAKLEALLARIHGNLNKIEDFEVWRTKMEGKLEAFIDRIYTNEKIATEAKVKIGAIIAVCSTMAALAGHLIVFFLGKIIGGPHP